MDMILDTCGFLSLAGLAKKRLSRATLAQIESVEKLYVSSCSLFEIAIKCKKGNLQISPFDTAIELWETAVREYQLEEIAVSSKAFFRATELADIHSDPFDHIIIVEALSRKIPIVTYDTVFSDYGVKVLS